MKISLILEGGVEQGEEGEAPAPREDKGAAEQTQDHENRNKGVQVGSLIKLTEIEQINSQKIRLTA